jgi:hypothetical protein
VQVIAEFHGMLDAIDKWGNMYSSALIRESWNIIL